MKYLIIGDIHMKDKLGYADFISDGRKEEKRKVLDYIFKLSKDCDKVVFMGDQLNGRNNSSEVIKEFVQYLEKFKQDVFLIAGNHEKMGDGKSAIDFLKEIQNKKWHIITNEVTQIEEDVFCPYFYKGELEGNDNKDASAKLLEILTMSKMGGEPTPKNLFIHHAVSGYKIKNINTDDLNEIVLPKKELSKFYDKIFCGHIHLPSDGKMNPIYTGSIFNNEVNEGEKFVWTMKDGEVERHKLPGRDIIKLENPTVVELSKYKKDTIIKAILSEKVSEEELLEIKEQLAQFDGSILIEDFRTERKIVKFTDGKLDLNITNLMRIYAEEKKLDFAKLQDGYDLIK